MSLKDIVSPLFPAVVVVQSKDSVGTGFIVDKNGFILTTAHAITDVNNVSVVTGKTNPNSIPAVVREIDRQTDIAVLKIDAGYDLDFFSLGDSSKVRTGEEIAFIGFPLGTGIWGSYIPAIHRGIVSSVIHYTIQNDRGPKTINLFQLDGMANPGNSGGPVILRETGEVVAIISKLAVDKPWGDTLIIGGKPLATPTGIGIATTISHAIDLLEKARSKRTK